MIVDREQRAKNDAQPCGDASATQLASFKGGATIKQPSKNGGNNMNKLRKIFLTLLVLSLALLYGCAGNSGELPVKP